MRYVVRLHDRDRRFLYLLSVATLLIVLIGCGSAAQTGAPHGAMPPPPVTFLTVQAEDVPVYSDFAAQTYARHQVDVRGRVEGYVEKWLFQPGDQVSAAIRELLSS